MQETPDAQVANVASHYRNEYKKRYGKEPLNLNAADNTLIKDMLRAYGVTQLKSLITQFFKMDSDRPGQTFYRDRGHDLNTLKMCAKAVHACTGSSSKAQYVVGYSTSWMPVISDDPNILSRDLPQYFTPIEVTQWEKLMCKKVTEHVIEVGKQTSYTRDKIRRMHEAYNKDASTFQLKQ